TRRSSDLKTARFNRAYVGSWCTFQTDDARQKLSTHIDAGTFLIEEIKVGNDFVVEKCQVKTQIFLRGHFPGYIGRSYLSKPHAVIGSVKTIISPLLGRTACSTDGI